MSEFEDACSAWVDSVGSSRSDGTESEAGSPFCQGESLSARAGLAAARSGEFALLRGRILSC